LGVWEIVEPPAEHRLIVYSRAQVVGGTLTAGSDLADVRFWPLTALPTVPLTPLVRQVLTALDYLNDQSSERAA
jgi:hypothetical protein